ncbi:hypothetical protein P8A22_14425 [Streptomyces laculatispora]|uniref:Uncharacterized protein n=1 Tax=Streptomyces laculatispora TaxID=887464 RepID=A0ABY9I4D1_9ACTN|nr:hypothetical protein [Streptomyces laculatispora]WLQ41082.1 hypothetical protein P8A22_14425 [Streptomyces laculatispora]
MPVLLHLMNVNGDPPQTVAEVDDQMYLAQCPSNSWFGYVEGHDSSPLLTDPKVVSAMLQRYGKMRSQALSHEPTACLLKQMQGGL